MTDTTAADGPDDPEPTPSPGPTGSGPSNEELRGPRPAPAVASLAGAAAGVFVVFGLFSLLGELGDDARLAGIGISLVFEALGVVLLQFSKGRRSATAGGTIAAVALVPLLGFLFVDTPDNAVSSTRDVTASVTGALVVAALVWFCAWYFGPGRRYAFFLAAACLALWLAAQVQIVSDPLDQLFVGTSTFAPVGSVLDEDSFSSDPYSSDEFSDTTLYDFSDPDSFETSDLDSFQIDPSDEEDFGIGGDVDDPSTKLGVVSLLFGCGYLMAAARRDRAGDGRAGTALFAVSAPILVYAVAYLAGDLRTVGTSLLGLFLGGCALWLGTRTGRRFTSWAGTAACIFAVVSLVDEAVGESGRASAAVLVSIGLAIAIAVAVLERRSEAPGPAAGPLPEPGPSTADPGAAAEPPRPGTAF